MDLALDDEADLGVRARGGVARWTGGDDDAIGEPHADQRVMPKVADVQHPSRDALGHVRRNYLVGDTLNVNVLRRGKRVDLKLRLR